MTDLKEVKATLESHSRESLVSLASNGLNLPRPILILAYTQIQSMSQEKINILCDKTIAAVDYILAGDFPGLEDYLNRETIPPPLIKAIIRAINENGNK